MKLLSVLMILNLIVPPVFLQSPGCSIYLDMVIVLDSSGSIRDNNPEDESYDNWDLAVKFVQELVKAFGVSSNTNRIGLVMYSRLTFNIFYMDTYTTTQEVVDAVGRLKDEYLGSWTNTQQGIQYMHKQQFVLDKGDRSNVRNLAVIITDGVSTVNPENTIPAAEAARRDGIIIVSIGVSDRINEDELRAMSSMPQTLGKNYFTADFSTLNDIIGEVVSETCGTTTPFPTPSATPIPTLISSRCTKDLDIVIVLDSSGSIRDNNPVDNSYDNWDLAVTFVQKFVSAMGASQSTNKFGLVMFSGETVNQFYLDTYSTTQDVVDAVGRLKDEYLGGDTNTQQGIQYMHEHQFVPNRGDRSDATNLAIIITDGVSTINRENTIPAAEAARQDYILIVSIGVSGRINEDELKAMSSMPQRLDETYFIAADFQVLDELTSKVVPGVCQVQSTSGVECNNKISGASILAERYSSAQEAGFEFHCNFDYEVSSPYEVTVLWYLDERWFRTDTISSGTKAVLRDVDWVNRRVKLGFWVHCSTQVVAGSCSGEVRKSERYFAGIKIRSNPQVENVDDIAEITMKEGATAYIYLGLTVPLVCKPNAISFCKFDIEVHAPDTRNIDPKPPKCAENLAEIQKLVFTDADTTKCHYEVNVTNQENWIRIPVVAVRDGLYDPAKGYMLRLVKLKTPTFIFVQPTWQDYEIGDVRVKIEDTDILTAGINCFSRSDPWLSSFDTDGRSWSFSFHDIGEFVFYEHDTLPIKVHIFTYLCSSNRQGTCTCAVAIQAGSDVVIIDKCDGNYSSFNQKGKSRFATHGCEGLGKGLRIIENSIDDYEVHLPTGASVSVTKGEYKPWNWVWLQVVLKPSDQDFNATSGLCGRWNNDRSDDKTPKPGSFRQSFVESWRVPFGQSLYNGDVLDSTRELYGHVYCDCADDGNAVECDASPYHLCEETKDISLIKKEKCYLKKRSTGDDDGEDNIEYIFNPNINSSPISDTWPTPSGIIEAGAVDACENRLVRSNAGTVCGAVDSLQPYQQQSVDECVGDIRVSDTYLFVNGTYDNFVEICRKEIVVNLANWDFNRENGTPLPLVLETLCPSNCLGKGKCIAGKCQCDEGFFDIDCSRGVNDPPETNRLVRDGLCDYRIRPCISVIVYGAYFFKSNTLLCHMKPVKVTDQVTTLKSPILMKAIYEYSEEVRCPIPSWPEDADVGDGNQGYKVSVSNNGQNPGDEFLFLKYDSSCEICNSTSQSCVKKTNVCRIGGFCYNDQERPRWNECFLCDIAVSKENWKFIDSQECQRKCQNGGTFTIDNNCICPVGYTGQDCSIEINRCDSSPCQNGATCIKQLDTYSCQCIEGYIGVHCSVYKPSGCSNDPCVHGDCVEVPRGIQCDCYRGYIGVLCEIDINECLSLPCKNGGTCVDRVALYTCTCPEDFIGSNCETNLFPCNSNPCQNGGICREGTAGYKCSCIIGYTGKYCEFDINECESAPCLNGGTCKNEENRYICQCPYTHSGVNCATPSKENRPRTIRPTTRPTTTRPTVDWRRATTRPNRLLPRA